MTEPNEENESEEEGYIIPLRLLLAVRYHNIHDFREAWLRNMASNQNNDPPISSQMCSQQHPPANSVDSDDSSVSSMSDDFDAPDETDVLIDFAIAQRIAQEQQITSNLANLEVATDKTKIAETKKKSKGNQSKEDVPIEGESKEDESIEDVPIENAPTEDVPIEDLLMDDEQKRAQLKRPSEEEDLPGQSNPKERKLDDDVINIIDDDDDDNM